MNKEEKIKGLQKEITLEITRSRNLLQIIYENKPQCVYMAEELRPHVLREINKNIRKLGRLDKNALIYFEAWPKENINNNNIKNYRL